ncbi:MAG TPA: hypothetical protein EYQ18_01615 [Candidatus Handelsmanbacteria bacterium]|nr:hypothetical protein [Candidatus Handelsmanbacteria bacterium]
MTFAELVFADDKMLLHCSAINFPAKAAGVAFCTIIPPGSAKIAKGASRSVAQAAGHSAQITNAKNDLIRI